MIRSNWKKIILNCKTELWAWATCAKREGSERERQTDRQKVRQTSRQRKRNMTYRLNRFCLRKYKRKTRTVSGTQCGDRQTETENNLQSDRKKEILVGIMSEGQTEIETDRQKAAEGLSVSDEVTEYKKGGKGMRQKKT